MARLIAFLIPIIVILNSIFFSAFYTPNTLSDINKSKESIIVFFGTTPKINGITNIYFQSRLEAITDLTKNLDNYKIFISGFHTDNYSEIESMYQSIEQIPVSRKQIITHFANDTYDSIRQLKKIHQTNTQAQIVLVSQRFHLERANILAKFLQIPVINIESPVNHITTQKLKFREYFARIKVYFDLLKFLNT